MGAYITIENVGKRTFILNVLDKPTARGSVATVEILRETPKARWSDSKREGYYGYHSIESAKEAFNGYVERCKRASLEREEYKKKRREARKAVKASDFYLVGDIIYSSWGYEQTNIDFYQVIGVTEKTIKVQEIRQSVVAGSTYSHGMACNVSAVPDTMDEVGEKPFTLRVGENGRLSSIKGYRYASKWDGRPLYNSWYY